MGQYHVVANTDRLEYLDPRWFGDGPKLTEFGFSAGGTLSALTALLAVSSGRGFGDLHTHTAARPGLTGQTEWLAECAYTPGDADRLMLGRWAGNRVAVIGDYAKETDLSDWGQCPMTGERLAPGGPWGNDKGQWLDVSRLGLVLMGLEEAQRDEARLLLNPTGEWSDAVPAVSAEQLTGIALPTL